MPRRLPENRTIEVILLKQDKHLGEKYEIVRVKPIFARNVLLIQGTAVLATKENVNKYQQKMASAEKERINKAKNLEDLFVKIDADGGLKIVRKTNQENSLYAKVHEEDVVQAIKEKYGIDTESHYFKLKKKITTTGDYTVPFIFKDLKKDIKVTVEAEPEVDTKKKPESKTEDKAEEKTE